VSANFDNPPSVIWSHSDSRADFYELPTDGKEMHEALGWLLEYYDSVKLWMGLESSEGAELFLTASPSKESEVVKRLRIYDDPLDVFDRQAQESELAG